MQEETANVERVHRYRFVEVTDLAQLQASLRNRVVLIERPRTTLFIAIPESNP
jgi:hypothetical protein